MGTDGSLTETISDLVWNGLTILTGSKTKYGTASVNGESQKFIQWGGGKANGDRSCYFTAPASGKRRLWHRIPVLPKMRPAW